MGFHPQPYSRATLKVFAFTPKILVQLDTLCPLMVFLPSTGSSLKLAWCLPIATHFFSNSNTMTSCKISSTHKCQSINHKYTHHYCHLKSVHALNLCTRAAMSRSSPELDSSLQWLSLTKVRADPQSQFLPFLEAVWQTHCCAKPKEMCVWF